MRELSPMGQYGFCCLLLVAGTACESASHERELTRLALRVDSMAVALTAVVNAVQPGAARQAAPESLTVSTKGASALGRAHAPVTIVEFTDYQCPFCARHATTTLQEIRKAYIDKGLVRYVVRDMPLEQLHPLAVRAAATVRCASAESAGSYWAYHDRLFANQGRIADTTFGAIAQALGLDLDRFTQCVSSGRFMEAVRQDLAAATAAGLSGTPAFVIGRTAVNDSVTGVTIRGAYPFAQFKAAIDAALEPVQVLARE